MRIFELPNSWVIVFMGLINTVAVKMVYKTFVFSSLCACRRAVLTGERSFIAPCSTYSQGSSMPPLIADTPSGEDLGGPVIVDISHPGTI